MAKNSMNFNLKMGLDSKNFKRGINEVQGLMNGFKSSLLSFGAAIGAGFSFGALFSELKQAALELDTAMNTLKNVSKETHTFQTSIGEVSTSVSIFGENLEYVRQLADTYGQDLAAITHGFAKFTAACNNTGLALDQQRYIYEQLTRAAAYYHLSAYESQNVMNAVVQMMSKGKIAAEELRRQLGNSLPGAFNLMAKAMGVSTAELDKLMKEGKVISAEVLPLFAQELEKVTKGGNFDSIQLSLNKLKNAWYDFTTNSDFATYFKKGVDVATQALDFLSKNFNHLMTLLLSIGTLKLFQGIGAKGAAELQIMVTKAQELDLMLKKAEASMMRLSSKKGGFEIQKMGGYNVAIPYATTTDVNLLRHLEQYNQKLLELHNLKLKVYGQPIFSPAEVAQIQSANNAMRAMQGTLATSTPILSKFAIGFKTLGKTIATSLKQIAKATIYTALIQLAYEGIMWIVDSIKSANEEVEKMQEELDAIYTDYRNNFEEEVDAAEKRVEQARYYLNVLKDINKSEGVRQLALEKLAELVDDIDIEKIDVNNINESADAYKRLAERVEAWADASIKAAAISVLAQEAGAALVNQRKAQQRINEIDLSGGALTETTTKMVPASYGFQGTVTEWKDVTTTKDTALGTERKQLVAKVAEYQKILDDANIEMKALDEELSTILNSGGDDGDGGGGDKPLEGIDKVYDDYLKAAQELKNKLKEGAIFQSDYDEQLKKLIEKTFGDAAATGQLSISNIMDKIDKGQTLTAMETWYKDIATQATGSMMNAMFLEAEQLLEELNREIDEDLENMMENNPAVEQMKEKVRQYQEYLSMIPTAGNKSRSTLFDYNKSKSDILSEQFDLAKERVDDIQSIIDKLEELQEQGHKVTQEIENWSRELEIAQVNAKSFEDAMNLAKIREDIQAMSYDLGVGIYDSIVNTIGSINNVVSQFERMRDTLESVDATGWEKFISIFSTFVSMIDTGIGIYETFSKLAKINNALIGAEASEQAVLNSMRATGVALIGQETAAKGAATAIDTANNATKSTEIGLNAALLGTLLPLVAEYKAMAVAKAVESAAALPFPANIPAMAASAAAAATSMQLAKFEKGGWVGGNSYSGDKVLARVNSGELILNRTQQSTLWNLLNGKGGIGGKVQFELRGDKLIGLINNTISKKRG